MLEVRRYLGTDFATLERWWKARGWPGMDEEILPGTGFVAMRDGQMIAAVFLYLTNSPIAWLTWLVGNPDVSKALRHDGIKDVMAEAMVFARERGVKRLFTSVRIPAAVRAFEESGFVPVDRGMIELIRRL